MQENCIPCTLRRKNNTRKGKHMEKKNICKFIPDRSRSELRTVSFIFETDPVVQEAEAYLGHHALFLIKTGGFFYFDKKAVQVFPGDLVLGFSGERFYAKGNNFQYYYIKFNGLRSEDLFKRFGISPLNRIFKGYEGMLPFWKENIARATGENIDLIAESVLIYAFSKLSAVHEQLDDAAYALTKYIEENFTDTGLSLNSAAEALGYNAKYLSSCFKKINIGFSEYVRTLRINNAVFLMEHGVESVKNVAVLSGFQDPLYFSKVFKAVIGQSPTEYIKKLHKTDR